MKDGRLQTALNRTNKYNISVEVLFVLLYYREFVYIHVLMLFDFLFSVFRTRGSGVTVAVLLRWEPPREGDLPVHSYRVTWMSRHTLTAHKHTHALHGRAHMAHNNMHTRPTHPRTAEGKKESNSRVTQGVRQLYVYLLTIKTVTQSLLY